MATPEKPVQLKVFVDKRKKKVMFAEASSDFVDILFSFLTLPLGTIAKLSSKHLKDIKIGSLTSLYESVVSLNEKHFAQGVYKDCLLNPINSSASICQKLKVNLDDTKPFAPSCHGDAVLVKNFTNFIITDNLNVAPVMLDTSIVLNNFLGVENINMLEERTMYFGLEEFLNLLNWSLLTNNPLTSMVLGGGKPCSSCTTNSTLSSSPLISSNSGKTRTLVKLLVQKSKNKLLCAQVENLFVELLFSFLTIPLGSVIHLTKGGSSSLGISNLHNSISRLGDGKHLKSEDIKTMLLFPKVAAKYHRVTDFLPIYEGNTRPGHFLKEQAPFIISNDLEIIASPSITTLSRFNTLGVPAGDMEILEVRIGENEALSLLKASLTSTSALTDFLKVPRKKAKVEPST